MKPAKYEVGQVVDVRHPERQASGVEIVEAIFLQKGGLIKTTNGYLFYGRRDCWIYNFSDGTAAKEEYIYPHNPPATDSWETLHKQLVVEGWVHQAKELVNSD